MIDLDAPAIYEKVVEENDTEQVRLVINTFRGIEYISLRKYYMDFDEEWKPTRQGVTMALDLSNSKRLFEGLVEILSLAESKAILEDNFKDLLEEIYL